jgi:hypothetical protein
MKLRIRGNSIRLRLLQTEVAALAEKGNITEKISFGSTPLFYSISAAVDAEKVSAHFRNNQITIYIPSNTVRAWANSDQVSIEGDQNIDQEGDALKILIEKDFVCLDRKDDPDNADAFPHPAANC